MEKCRIHTAGSEQGPPCVEGVFLPGGCGILRSSAPQTCCNMCCVPCTVCTEKVAHGLPRASSLCRGALGQLEAHQDRSGPGTQDQERKLCCSCRTKQHLADVGRGKDKIGEHRGQETLNPMTQPQGGCGGTGSVGAFRDSRQDGQTGLWHWPAQGTGLCGQL